jgi:hypothetical protein
MKAKGATDVTLITVQGTDHFSYLTKLSFGTLPSLPAKNNQNLLREVFLCSLKILLPKNCQ